MQFWYFDLLFLWIIIPFQDLKHRYISIQILLSLKTVLTINTFYFTIEWNNKHWIMSIRKDLPQKCKTSIFSKLENWESCQLQKEKLLRVFELVPENRKDSKMFEWPKWKGTWLLGTIKEDCKMILRWRIYSRLFPDCLMEDEICPNFT